MSEDARQAAERAIAALTYQSIERISLDGELIAKDGQVPLLQRSVAQELRALESRLGMPAVGKTMLWHIADGIDEALLAMQEIITP